MANLTEISRKMVRSAFKAKTTAEAISLLKESAQFRTLIDILHDADATHSSEEELKKRIIEGLCLHHPDKNAANIARTVSNWFAGRVQSIKNRETVFELCLILGLSLNEANHFIMRLSEEGIHWRNPREIVWGYAFVHKLSYQETVDLIDTAEKACRQSKKNLTGNEILTHLIRNEVLQHLNGSPEELVAYIAENADKWSSFHNTAYDLYTKYMFLLQYAASTPEEFEQRQKRYEEEKKANRDKPNAEIKTDDVFTVGDILDTYFFRSCIENYSDTDALQRCIRMNWPDESAISKMKKRSNNKDVSRKVLILLFLATNGDASEFQITEEEVLNEHRTRDRVFKNIRTRLNHMLSCCGFQPLDPRNRFDWMIIYCICAEDIYATDRRLEDVLTTLFPENEVADEEDAGKEKQRS